MSNARIEIALATGTYVIAATSFAAGETGEYELALN